MSYLIIGGTLNQQRKQVKQIIKEENVSLKTSNPDLLLISEEDSIGINQIRQIKTFLSKKSWQSQSTKTVIIYQADTMTPQAQNAFLKTLEEPPANSLIIITASNKNSLIPTIISRCQIIRIANEDKTSKEKLNKYWEKWQKITQSTLDKKLGLASKLKKEDLNQFIFALQNQIKKKGSNKLKIKSWLENLITARQMLENNVNLHHVVDWLILKL